MRSGTLRKLLPWGIALLITAPAVVSAAGFLTIVPQGYNCNGIGGCNSICAIAQLAQNILNDAIFLAVVISAVLFAIAGWQYMTAGGDTGKATSARKIFTNVLIGIVIILAAWLIVDTLMKTLTGGSFGPWNSVCSGYYQNTGGAVV